MLRNQPPPLLQPGSSRDRHAAPPPPIGAGLFGARPRETAGSPYSRPS
jgi:hypothetical protein